MTRHARLRLLAILLTAACVALVALANGVFG
jgi:hypothetical protein